MYDPPPPLNIRAQTRVLLVRCGDNGVLLTWLVSGGAPATIPHLSSYLHFVPCYGGGAAYRCVTEKCAKKNKKQTVYCSSSWLRVPSLILPLPPPFSSSTRYLLYLLIVPNHLQIFGVLKELSHEIDFKNFDKYLLNLA